MPYVDGYVLPVKTAKLDEYKKLAEEAGEIWIKNGALEYVECKADDLTSVNEWGGYPFPKTVDCKEDETVIFAYVVYESKAHRDEVNAKVHKDMEANKEKHKETNMPFELERMAFGGFETIVDLHK